MPKLFGEKNPAINDELAVKIFKFFDSETLVLKAPAINKDWQRISNLAEVNKQMASYRLMLDRKIFRHSPLFKKETPDSMEITRTLGGWTNLTFIAKQKKNKYVLRLAGKNTDFLINRDEETYNAKIATECGVNPDVIFSAKNGAQVTAFIEDPITLSASDFKNPENIDRIIEPLKKIHCLDEPFANTVDVFERNKEKHQWLVKSGVKLGAEYEFASKKMQELAKLFSLLPINKVPCHNDLTSSNFMYSAKDKERMYLIDWEYSNNNDPVWDLAIFAIEASLSRELEAHLLNAYFGTEEYVLERLRFQLYKPIGEYWSALWAQIQILNGNDQAGLETLKEYEQKRIMNCKKLFESDVYNSSFKELKKLLAPTPCCRCL